MRNLFQPVADTAYPSALDHPHSALAVWAGPIPPAATPAYPHRLLLAAVSGMVMAFGMAFSLVFLPVGLIVALWSSATLPATWRIAGGR